ncbi:hypothetical protein L1987_18569 [Smallanthus sonchifolius]|uniref:Uncharacterized protein n=1 Tax=Smallanthus sonchifolius TaxID=185202 RepID=A0ACB9IZY0_9ASTR|nr:hypothetical protein L1987_18569 [Smallanthus sonchifolius]
MLHLTISPLSPKIPRSGHLKLPQAATLNYHSRFLLVFLVWKVTATPVLSYVQISQPQDCCRPQSTLNVTTSQQLPVWFESEVMENMHKILATLQGRMTAAQSVQILMLEISELLLLTSQKGVSFKELKGVFKEENDAYCEAVTTCIFYVRTGTEGSRILLQVGSEMDVGNDLAIGSSSSTKCMPLDGVGMVKAIMVERWLL